MLRLCWWFSFSFLFLSFYAPTSIVRSGCHIFWTTTLHLFLQNAIPYARIWHLPSSRNASSYLRFFTCSIALSHAFSSPSNVLEYFNSINIFLWKLYANIHDISHKQKFPMENIIRLTLFKKRWLTSKVMTTGSGRQTLPLQLTMW